MFVDTHTLPDAQALDKAVIFDSLPCDPALGGKIKCMDKEVVGSPPSPTSP